MKKVSISLSWCFILTVIMIDAPRAVAYPDWSGCSLCHGDFRASNYISPADGQNWGNLHNLHRNTMLAGDCNTCHGSSFFPVLIDSSNGGTGFEAISCMGCHGRTEDIGGDGLSAGRGAGLRQHHNNSGVTVCGICHTDANPLNYTPVGEDVRPPYYFTPDGVHPNKPTDPCSPNGGEDFAGFLNGLDNDGDLVRDTSDPDCAAAAECGNGVLDVGEKCDDGNLQDGDCCSANCTFEPAGSSCGDGDLCNGDETCDGAGTCDPGIPLDCDDGLFCNGVEVCDPTAGCASPDVPVAMMSQSTEIRVTSWNRRRRAPLVQSDPSGGAAAAGNPCPPGTVCNEMTDSCDSVTECGNGVLDAGEECDDGNLQNGDCCGAGCMFEPVGSSCADGDLCNGDESCDGAGTCNEGFPLDCDDGLFCNGMETCDSTMGCVSTGNPCPADAVCNEITASCDPVDDGRMLYTQWCGFCHGDFDQDPKVAPIKVLGVRPCSIEGAINGTDGYPNGVPSMQFLQGLITPDEILSISEYMNSQPVFGIERYITACSGCHGIDASGGIFDEGVRGEDAEEIFEAIADEDAMRFLDCLTDADVDLIGAYLRSLEEDHDDSDSHGDSDSDDDSDDHDDSDSDEDD
jgi:cysteine-rich repeat protein